MTFSAPFEFNYGSFFLAEYTVVFVLQALLYLVAAGSVAFFYKGISEFGIGERIEQRPNYGGQVISEILWALGACAIIAWYIYLSLAFIEAIYTSSWLAALVHIFGFIVFYDFYMYLTHRGLHSDRLRKFHARHHTAVSATPWSCINLHPVEALINYLPFLLFAVLTPVSLSVFIGIHIYLLFGIANGHSNYRMFPASKAPALLTELTHFHQQHHTDGRSNFGYLYTHWDWVFGTRHG